MLNLFEVPGAYNPSGKPDVAAPAYFKDIPGVSWHGVEFSGSMSPLSKSVADGVVNLIADIEANPGPFALAGTSAGAIVVSDVYDQLRTGVLTHRRADLVAAVTIGNPRRERGHAFPGCPDPGGHGIDADRLLVGTEDFWWDFAVPGDNIACCPDGPIGELLDAGFDYFMGRYKSLWSLLPLVFRSGGGALIQAVLAFVNTFFVHGFQYSKFAPLAGDTRNCMQIATDYLASVAAEMGS